MINDAAALEAAPRASVSPPPAAQALERSVALSRVAAPAGWLPHSNAWAIAGHQATGVRSWRQLRFQAPGWWLPALALAVLLLVAPGTVAPVLAADLQVSGISLEPCPAEDAGSQPELRRPGGASCYALRGEVRNPGRRPVVDTDVFALILDSSGEPVLPNRSRVGSIGDVPPGLSEFALRLAIPAGTPGPFTVKNPRARGFSAPVRTRAAEGEELLPLEEAVSPS